MKAKMKVKAKTLQGLLTFVSIMVDLDHMCETINSPSNSHWDRLNRDYGFSVEYDNIDVDMNLPIINSKTIAFVDKLNGREIADNTIRIILTFDNDEDKKLFSNLCMVNSQYSRNVDIRIKNKALVIDFSPIRVPVKMTRISKEDLRMQVLA